MNLTPLPLGLPLHRTQSRPRRNGRRAGGLPLVQRAHSPGDGLRSADHPASGLSLAGSRFRRTSCNLPKVAAGRHQRRGSSGDSTACGAGTCPWERAIPADGRAGVEPAGLLPTTWPAKKGRDRLITSVPFDRPDSALREGRRPAHLGDDPQTLQGSSR